MFTVTSYIVFWVIIFVLFGAIWYNFDRRFGVRLYRTYFTWTHKDTLPEHVERGFIYNQTTRNRVAAALVVSTIQSILAVINTEVNPLVELMMWVVEVPVTLLGFHLGPLVHRLWEKQDHVYTMVDRLESGELNVKDKLAEGIENLTGGIREAPDGLVPDTEEAVEDPAPPGEAEEKQPPAAEPEADPAEYMDRFIRDRRKGRGDG